MCTAVTNGMKALKDGHLRELHVLFHPHKDTDELIEMHKFSFNLPKDRAPTETGDDKISNQAINDLVKKSTMKLLRILSGNLQSFGHLPDDAAMSIRLIYDDDAPEDYNPVIQDETFSRIASSPRLISEMIFQLTCLSVHTYVGP